MANAMDNARIQFHLLAAYRALAVAYYSGAAGVLSAMHIVEAEITQRMAKGESNG